MCRATLMQLLVSMFISIGHWVGRLNNSARFFAALLSKVVSLLFEDCGVFGFRLFSRLSRPPFLEVWVSACVVCLNLYLCLRVCRCLLCIQ